MQTNQSPVSSQKNQTVVIFVTVFIYLLGFGIIIPVIPTLAQELKATPLQIGLLMSIFSLMQFIFAPFWGHLSDRYGRRPILLFCLIGEAASYIFFAQMDHLDGLFIARALAGFFGASISTASAYISDITPENKRSQGMALIGAAFGLGFLFGPALGGMVAQIAPQYSTDPLAGAHFCAYAVSLLCLVNLTFGLFKLKESLPEEKRHKKVLGEHAPSRLAQIRKSLFQSEAGFLIAIYFCCSFAMSLMEATLILLVGERFQWGLKEVSFGFAYIGFISVLMQGLIVRRLLPKVGERKMIFVGVLLQATGLAGIALSGSVPAMAITMTVLSIGNSLTNPSLMGGISLLTSVKEQGIRMGSAQSMASLGSILGPALGGFVYGFQSYLPFLLGGLISLLGFAVAFLNRIKIPSSAKATAGGPSSSVSEGALPVGEFQFQNLIRTKVPFVLVNMGVDFTKNFKSLDLVHVQKCEWKVSESLEAKQIFKSALQKLKDDKQPLHQAVTCVAHEEAPAKLLANQLTKAGYTNVYYYMDGWKINNPK